MSTLVTTHDGLERFIRGGQAFAEMLGRAPVLRPEARAAGAPEASARALPGWIARFLERARERRQNRLFEELMHQDPRVYAEVQAAAARQEWR